MATPGWTYLACSYFTGFAGCTGCALQAGFRALVDLYTGCVDKMD